MTTTTHKKRRLTPPSSRLGRKNYKSPPPLRFSSVANAKKYIKANQLKTTDWIRHRAGVRINVVDEAGKPRTISIELPKKEDE